MSFIRWGNLKGWGYGIWGGLNPNGTAVPTAMAASSKTPTITYRTLDDNYDPICGQGQANFLTDIDAVSQAILTRINLFEAEWWADQQDGTPMWQRIMGAGASVRDQQAISLILQQRILKTPYVAALQNVQYSFDSPSRTYKFYCEVQTQFGTVSVTNLPVPPTQELPTF